MKHFYKKRLYKLWTLCLCLSILPGSFTNAANKHTITKTSGVLVGVQLNAITSISAGDTLSFVGAVFEGTNMWYNSDWFNIRSYINTKGIPLVIELLTPDVTIPNHALASCSNLAGIDFPNVQTIGEYTFQNSSGLANVNLPELLSIKKYAFQNTSLGIVDLPKVQTIGESGFAGSGLTTFIAPQLHTLSGISTFYQCPNLTNVDIPNVQDIPQNTFYQCSNLTNVGMSNMVTIGNGAFYQCTSLINANCSKATSLGNTSFQGCTNLVNADLTSVISTGNYTFSGCTKLIGIKLPNVTSTGNYTFNNCTSLTEVDAPKLQTIGDWAFKGATGLTNINLPTVQTLGTNAFEGCSNLEFAFLHNLSNMGESAFKSCPSLKYMELGAPPTMPMPNSAFGGNTGAVLIVVPDTIAYGPALSYPPYSPGSEVHLRRVSTEARMFDPAAPETLEPLRGDLNPTLAGGGTFVWKKDGYPIAGANTSSYTPTEPGWYTLEFTHGGTVVLQSIYLAAETVEVPDSRARYADCSYNLVLTFTPSGADRTVTVSTKGSGAAYVKDVASGNLFKDKVTYKLPKNKTMLEIPYEVIPGMGDNNQVQFEWEVSDFPIVYDTDVFTLYDAHEITYRYYRPTVNYKGVLEVYITGGSLYMERSRDGGITWELARDIVTGDPIPFTQSQIYNLEVPYLLFRQPNTCAPNDTLRLFDGHEPTDILREVLMPSVTDAICSVEAGEHYVSTRNNFTFTLTGLKSGYSPRISTNRVIYPDSDGGLVVERNEDGSYTVRILNIQEPTIVSIDFTVGNNSIEGTRVWGVDGVLHLQCSESCKALIYTLSGAFVQHAHLAAGETYSMPLAKGCYFVTIGKTTYKVIL